MKEFFWIPTGGCWDATGFPISLLPASPMTFTIVTVKPWFLPVCVFSCLALPAVQANEAEITIACQSIAVYSASAEDAIGSTYDSSFTTDFTEEGVLNSLNNEWYPVDGTVGYLSAVQLVDTLFEVTHVGLVQADIPLPGDSNLNFITDFFEVDRAVSAQTSGTIDYGDGAKPVKVTWSREAGQALGSVELSLPSPSPVGDALTFQHTFEILQYRGKLTYTPAEGIGKPVNASVNLTRLGAEGSFKGPLPMVVSDVRTLERTATQWTAADQTVFDVLGTFEVDGVELYLDKLPSRPWYAGSFFFMDGIPSTPFQDEFDLYDVFVNDPNDGDGDGIPDLTDPVSTVVPDPPTVAVHMAEAGLQFTISGSPGSTVQLEHRSALSSGSWTLLQTVTLSAASETVVLSRPSADTFYRATIP